MESTGMMRSDDARSDGNEMEDYLKQFKMNMILDESAPSDDRSRRARRKRHKSHGRIGNRRSSNNAGSTGAGARLAWASGGTVSRVVSVSGVMLLAAGLVATGAMSGSAPTTPAISTSSLDGDASRTFAIPRSAVFAEAGAASRSSDREAVTIIDGDWGGIEDLEIPVTMSDADRKALDELSKTIKSAQDLHKESQGKVNDDKNRDGLKKIIGEAKKLQKSSMVVESSSKAKRKSLEDAMAKVKSDMKSKEESDAKAAREAMNAQLAANETVSNPTGAPVRQNPIDPSTLGKGDGDAVVSYAMGFVGYPYVWGAEGPSAFDCSGLVKYVYSKFGIALPHYSGAQMGVGAPVGSLADARPGDIVASSSHAAIYIGGGKIVNALNPSEGVKVTGLEVFGGGYVIRRVFN